MSKRSGVVWLIAVLAALSMFAVACGDDEEGSTDGTSEDGTSEDDGGGEDGGGSAAPECLDTEAVYALVGPESTGFGNWSDAASLAEELGSAYAADLPDTSLSITGPGEESGTYDTFVEFVVEGIAEERGLAEEEWAMRPDYTSSPNDNVIIEGIEGSPDSLGWVGYAFYQENQDRVRAISIADDSGNCVEPTAETIAAGEYPYSRPLFIYVNTAMAGGDNPVIADFVEFYLGDEGYAAVADAGYVQLTEDAWAETATAWEGSGITAGGETSGEIVISGSSTVEPITSLVAEAFSGANPDVGISVDGPGTGDGFELFCAGETDISDASRPIKEEEAAACEEAGIEYVELQVGIDGISVLTSK